MAKKARAHKRPDFSVPLVSSEVLITELAVEFGEFKTELMAEIRPRGAIAQMYADDVVTISWEIRRYWRTKISLINSEYRSALVNLFNQLTRPPSNVCSGADDVGEAEDDDNKRCTFDQLLKKLIDFGEVDFPEQWFTNPVVRAEFLELLKRYGLDEGYIEAEAIRLLSRDLDDLDRILMSLELRRERILRSLKDMQVVTNEERAANNKLLPFNGRSLNGKRAV